MPLARLKNVLTSWKASIASYAAASIRRAENWRSLTHARKAKRLSLRVSGMYPENPPPTTKDE